MRRALAIDEKSFGPEHPSVARDLNNLAALLNEANRRAEAEPLYRRALAIDERSYGPEHPKVASRLGNLAELLKDTGRRAEAEPLMRRALAISEKAYGPEHPDVAIRLNNLASLLRLTNRLAEAEPLMRRALASGEKSYGPEHPLVATRLSNLAGLLADTNRAADAEPLYRRALAIGEKSYGPEHPDVAVRLNNLAQLLKDTNRLAEAETPMRRALAIFEKSYGTAHPNVSAVLNNLAFIRAELGDWRDAARLHGRAKPVMTATRNREEGGDRSGIAKAELTRNRGGLRAAARAAFWAAPLSMRATEEGFELAQWALQTAAADALSQMSVRFAKGAGPLAQVVRDRQSLLARRQSEDRLLLAAFGKADAKGAEAVRTTVVGLDAKLDAIDKRLAKEFPIYAGLANPKPLTVAAARALLKPNEALIVFLDVPRFGKLPGETLAWAVTRTGVRWISIPLGTESLRERVTTLRCGLDRDGLWSWDGLRWTGMVEPCRQLRPNGLAAGDPLPFDLGYARELYWALLAPFDDLIRGKSLIIVPSGPLTSLPFHVLVTRPPVLDGGVPDYRKAQWLALKQSVTVLPSVGSLRALRKLNPSQAREAYLAFGNPLLDGGSGDEERAKEARAKQTCPQDPDSLRQPPAATAKTAPGLGAMFRGGAVDVAALRAQTPLPETADELCAVAKAMGALEREANTVWLGARATETNLKKLSSEGKLSTYKVLHFATHGLLAGESAAILKAKAEPALMLNPPKDGASDDELAHDDGLLTASEVAQLNLDADWVVLSACNTAAGEKGDAEALSGLARAFFYAKARSLLVSHWYVDSDAAVKLTTRTFAELRADRRIGRAEALRRSMVKMITSGTEAEAHPSAWAPFVLVGEGAR
jgi:CHAT domain-containing protein/tetratricopeptide (TPR) repeat protein